MKNKIGRRSFIIKTAAVGAMTMIGGQMTPMFNLLNGSGLQAAPPVDLSVVKGREYYQNTIKAVKQLGGMKKFVSRGSKVGLLANSPFKHFGAHAKPDIVLAVINMCYEAGAGDIYVLKQEFDGYWRRSTAAKKYTDEIASLKPGWTYDTKLKIPGAVSLKEATVTKNLLECDTLINVSITKDHTFTDFSCILKNMMGAASNSTNFSFHMPTLSVVRLSQRIADLNLIRKPDLSIADATEFISTNGPTGPGKIISPKKIVAGTDPVAVDSYCCRFLGLEPENVHMIQYAYQHQLGNFKLDELNILESRG